MAAEVVDRSSGSSFRTAPTSFRAVPEFAAHPPVGDSGTPSSFIPSIYHYYHDYHTRSFIDSISSPESVTRLDQLDPPIQHQRSISNPFDMLYDSNRRPDSYYSGGILNPHQELQSGSFQRLQNLQNLNTLQSAQAGATSGFQRNRVHLQPPTVTAIDQPAIHIRRTGSVVSSSASHRNRNRIKRRNKTLKRKVRNTESVSNSGAEPPQSLRDRLKFIFPVNRRRSLKYTSARQKQVPNFNSKEEFQTFLKFSNAELLTKEFLPKQMNFFHYDNILPPEPTIKSQLKHIAFQGGNPDFTIHPASAAKPKISVPYPSQLGKTKKQDQSHKRTISSIALPEIIYQKYKTAVFSGKYTKPPRFSEMFPNDVHLLSKSEINQINRKLLFEILLRRTLAAKLEYRLKQSREIPRSNSTGTSRSSGGSSGRSKNKNKDVIPEEPQFFPNLPHVATPRSSKSSSQVSINTEKLMQQNASLFSELLPSPQISYTSDIFGSFGGRNSLDLKSKDSLLVGEGGVLQKKSSQKFPSRQTSAKARGLSNPRGLAIIPYTLEAAPQGPLRSPRSPTESLYINDFNKAYYSKYKPKANTDFERTLFDSNVYQLKPMQRSAATLSTSDRSSIAQNASSKISPFKSDENMPVGGHVKHPSFSSSNKSKRHSLPASDGTKRKSQSTTNTSIFQNLDDLSSDLSSFMEGGYSKNVYSEIPPPSSPLDTIHPATIDQSLSQLKRHSLSSLDNIIHPKQVFALHIPVKSSSQTGLESLNRSKHLSPMELKSAALGPTKLSPLGDIKSLKGSISMAGSVYPTDLSESASDRLHDSPTQPLHK